MESAEGHSLEGFLQEDPFGSIRPHEFESMGIDPEDIPAGTFAARKHPAKLLSRFGGNAYGFGFFEIYDRLSPKDQQILQSLSLHNQEQTRLAYKEINRIYRNLGLLTRFSSLGKPFYLIPHHLLSSSLSAMRSKTEEISKIVDFHRRKYLKESHRIGLVTHADDQILNELTIRFKEHQFVHLDSFERLRSQGDTLDLVIVSRDLYELLVEESFSPGSGGMVSKKGLEDYALYLLGKIYRLLKPGGELFIIANRFPSGQHPLAKILFRTEQEEKNFLLFTHIFKTRKRYRPQASRLEVDTFDFQKYLNPPYVEAEEIDRLLGGRRIAEIGLDEIHKLPYLDIPLHDRLSYDQEKTWARLLSVYFSRIFLKPLVPEAIREEWARRFSTGTYLPSYMLIYLGQKRPPQITLDELKREVAGSRLSGCPLPLIDHNRDSYDYVIKTLDVLRKIKGGGYQELSQLFIDRLKEPLENKRRRYPTLAHVLRLLAKRGRLQRIQSFLNPGRIEGNKTRMLDSLETLSLFGFPPGELREIFLIVVGHSALERVLAGKMSEKALRPVTDLARAMEPLQALSFLRYCRLMSMAETSASKEAPLEEEEVSELFDIYQRMVRVVTNRDLGWDRLQEERTGALGGVRTQSIRKILKMMNHFQFLSNWAELSEKGEMEKESLADYDEGKLGEIEKVIRLGRTIDRFEKTYFKGDPLQAAVFYRRLLNSEFHGTAGIFGSLDSELVFPLLWITVNVTRDEVINFNPIFSDLDPSGVKRHLRRLVEGIEAINPKYLDPRTLEQLSEHLYHDESAFILGTGFRLKINRETGGMDIYFVDMEEDLRMLEILTQQFRGRRPSETPVSQLQRLGRVFANVEGFYRSHVRLLSHDDSEPKMPEREREWFRKAQRLRDLLRSDLITALFQPQTVHTELEILIRHCPALLDFLVPEVMAVERTLSLEGGSRKEALIESILARTKKLQALVECDRNRFQDSRLLHKAAQREFGPMTAGIVGLNDSQIETLEGLVRTIRKNQPLVDALVRSFILSGIGLHPSLRKKHVDRVHPSDRGHAGALILEEEPLAETYGLSEAAYGYLKVLIRHQDLLLHMIRGEFSFYALEDVVRLKDVDLFDAIFLSSFIMFYATGEDMILEELGNRLLQFRSLCHRIIGGETKADKHLEEVFAAKGHLFKALEAFHQEGTHAGPLESFEWLESERGNYLEAGKMIYALERIFRLRGIRYVEFADLAHFIARVPLRYIYRKRRHFGIGYGTFEKELFEAQRMYKAFQRCPEKVRHFILRRLVTDEVRLFGFERVSGFLSYENQFKLLWLVLLGGARMQKGTGPVSLDFLGLGKAIEKRFEAVNDFLRRLPSGGTWNEENFEVDALFETATGIVFRKKENLRVLSVDFVDPVDITRKSAYMKAISDEGQLKNYFHYTLRSLREHPFYTGDYELELENSFSRRLREITDQMLDQMKRQIEQLREFSDIRNLIADLLNRSLDIGFTEEQKHRLSDLYELRKDELKKEKLEEIESFLKRISQSHELRDYWDSIKWYLSGNREFLGKEFEVLVARRFDEAMDRIRATAQRTKNQR
jgi:SAM-dependent methyltransferase